MRVGLVAFATVADVVCPVTADREVVWQAVEKIQIDAIDNRTDIGLALAVAVERLRAAGVEGESGQIVLITDGAQRILDGPGPIGGARIAQALGVRIHVVDVGPKGISESAEQQVLRQVANISNGRYVRQSDELELLSGAIGLHAENAVRRATQPTWADLFPHVVLAALAIILIETILRARWLRVLPE
jgi:Ca-activated chloride channel family protein